MNGNHHRGIDLLHMMPASVSSAVTTNTSRGGLVASGSSGYQIVSPPPLQLSSSSSSSSSSAALSNIHSVSSTAFYQFINYIEPAAPIPSSGPGGFGEHPPAVVKEGWVFKRGKNDPHT